nr:hypothetical protein [Candidatus Methylobacter oryzae]
MSVEDFILYVYCCVEDIRRTIVNQPGSYAQAERRRSHHDG